MNRKIYIASGLPNSVYVQHLRTRFAQKNISLTYDWTTHNYIPDQQFQAKRQAAEQECDGIRAAKCVLVVTPGGSGTHFELGFSCAIGKPIVLFQNAPQDKNPSFYFLKELIVVRSEEAAIAEVVRIVETL